jgi:hypothetical protein
MAEAAARTTEGQPLSPAEHTFVVGMLQEWQAMQALAPGQPGPQNGLHEGALPA